MLCRRILGYRRSLTRLLLSAGIGAFYAVAVLPFPHPGIWLLHLAFGALLPLIACGFGSLRRFLRLLLYFFGISFFLGGAITAFLRGLAIFLAAGSGLHLTLSLILVAALAGGCFCLFFGNVTRSAPGKHAVTVTLRPKDRNQRSASSRVVKPQRASSRPSGRRVKEAGPYSSTSRYAQQGSYTAVIM